VCTILDFLHRITPPGSAADLPDGQLLSRFLQSQDESAFVALLQRHGPMVLGVCRRVLPDQEDAEDAFQATFLVLVRKARSIENHDSLASWLFGVARRIAVRAKRGSHRRHHLEGKVTPMAKMDELHEVIWKDLRPVLYDEVSSLPERCRAPFILCYLEGRTNEEAARLLGCPRGTVLSRLARARELLKAKLARRGVTLSAGALTALISENARASVPGRLSGATLRAAAAVATRQMLTVAAVSANVAVLTERMVKTMSLYAPRSALAVCLGIALLVGVVGLSAYEASATARPIQRSNESPPANQGEKRTGDAQKLQGTWEVTDAEMGGKAVPVDQAPLTKIRFSGDKMILIFGGSITKKQDTTARFTLDPSKNPKTIDFVVLEGEHKDKMGLGIYHLDGDRLRLVVPNVANTERPTEFSAPEGSNLIFFSMKRAPKEK
jgi:RNA polymerase sigma-70 factor (ECF subfamily)